MRTKPTIDLTDDQKRIVWHLRTSGPTARTELAIRLGLHNGAVTRLSRELIALGLISEIEANQTPRGRPTVPLTISSDGGYAAGATVHPGWLEIALVDFSGALIARDIEPFDDPNPRPFIKAVERRLEGLSMTHKLMRSRFLGLGIAATGPTNLDNPNRRWAVPWMKGWRDVDLTDLFSDYLGFAVGVENDASLAALAEYYDERLIRSCNSAIVFFIGHGVGGGIIIDRQLFGGDHGNAGEIGRLYPPGQVRPSGIDLLACLQEAGADITSLLDMEAYLDTHASLISGWMDRAAQQLAIAADSGVAWLDPGAIVISGAIPFTLLSGLAKRLLQADWAVGHTRFARPQIHVSRLGSLAVSMGAALLPIHRIGSAKQPLSFIS